MTGIKLTVLIVDDTPENIDVLSTVLEGMGCDLVVATSGPRALELAARRKAETLRFARRAARRLTALSDPDHVTELGW